MTGTFRHADRTGPATGNGNGTATARPPYFAALVNPVYLHKKGLAYTAVYSTRTGGLVTKVANPKIPGRIVTADRVAASPDGRIFYVEYDVVGANRDASNGQIWIYRFGITPAGATSPLTRVNGGVISGCAGANDGESLIASPDGTKLVLTANVGCWIIPGYATEVITLDLATGQHHEWQGGLNRKGKELTLPTISWTADSRSLVFLALWCNPQPGPGENPCTGTSGPNGFRDTQVRTLDVTTGGGQLTSGRVLLTQSKRFPVIQEAYAGPDLGDLTLVVLSGHVNAAGAWSELTIERVSAATGAVRTVLYRTSDLHGQEGKPGWILLIPDATGRHLLFSYVTSPPDLRYFTGSISGGRFRLLPGEEPYPAVLASFIGTW